MKIIEKMAYEYCGCRADVVHDQDDPGSCWAFIAGFRAAREMATKFANFKGTDCGAICESDLFLKLGEEEI